MRKKEIFDFDKIDILEIENNLHKKGCKYIACIDEVGRGCLAGNVVTCAIIIPAGLKIEGVNDSKKLTEKKREKLYSIILENCIAYGIGELDHVVVDDINIKNATKKAMLMAIDNLKDKDGNQIIPDHLCIDAEHLDTDIPQTSLIKGDARCHGIAAASIIAKVTRDRDIIKMADTYPGYDFEHNKGYGTKKHREALLKIGPCPIHRKTYLKKILGNEQLEMNL